MPDMQTLGGNARAVHAFLLTDIEGSARRWERFAAAMAIAAARHDAILADAVRAASGTLVKSTGDGILAVFAEVPQALAACAWRCMKARRSSGGMIILARRSTARRG